MCYCRCGDFAVVVILTLQVSIVTVGVKLLP